MLRGVVLLFLLLRPTPGPGVACHQLHVPASKACCGEVWPSAFLQGWMLVFTYAHEAAACAARVCVYVCVAAHPIPLLVAMSSPAVLARQFICVLWAPNHTPASVLMESETLIRLLCVVCCMGSAGSWDPNLVRCVASPQAVLLAYGLLWSVCKLHPARLLLSWKPAWSHVCHISLIP